MPGLLFDKLCTSLSNAATCDNDNDKASAHPNQLVRDWFSNNNVNWAEWPFWVLTSVQLKETLWSKKERETTIGEIGKFVSCYVRKLGQNKDIWDPESLLIYAQKLETLARPLAILEPSMFHRLQKLKK